MRCLFLLLAPVLFAQTDAKYSIHGRVEDDLHHGAIARADVTLLVGGKPLTAKTNDRGEYDFSDLAAGSYQLNVTKAGFFAQSYGEPISIGSSQKTELGDMTLVTERTISGTVRWADGDPVTSPLAGVQALSIKGGVNGPTLRSAGLGDVNDRGEFTIAKLQPGRYILFMQIRSQGGTAQMRELVARATGGTPDQKPRIVPTVFYPGQDAPNLANSIDLRTSAEFREATFTLEEKPGVEIEGMIQPSASVPAGTRVNVSLSSLPVLPAVQSFIFGGGAGQAGGPFEFHDIPPGNYLLLTHVGTSRRGAQPLSVGGAPIHLDITAPEPAPIQGRVEIQAADGSLSPAVRVRVSAACDELGLYGRQARATDANGDFGVTDTAPGKEYVLSFDAPSDTYVARITQDQRDFTGTVASAFAGGGPVRVLLKKDGGKITGQVQDADGKPSRGFVVLAPRNRKAADWYRTATAFRDGTFQLSSIAPGDYDLFALDQNEDDFYFDEAYLRKFKPTAVSTAANAAAAYQLEMQNVQP